MKMLHDLTFLDCPGDLPTCKHCGHEITALQWVNEEPCPGHPLDRVDAAGMSAWERMMFRDHGR